MNQDDLFKAAWMRKGLSTQAIADSLGVTREDAIKRAEEMGLPHRGRFKRDAFGSDELFTRMWNAGVLVEDIVRALGYGHRQTVQNRRRALGLPKRTRGKTPITLEQFKAQEAVRNLNGG